MQVMKLQTPDVFQVVMTLFFLPVTYKAASTMLRVLTCGGINGTGKMAK